MPGYDVDEIYRTVLALRERGTEGVLITVVEKSGSTPAPPGTKLLLSADGSVLGTVGGGALERQAIAKAQELLAQKSSLLARYALTEDDQVLDAEQTGMLCGGQVALFYEYLGQPLRIYLYGAGHVGRALVEFLKPLHVYVLVIDPRLALLEALSGVNRKVAADYLAALQGEPVPAGGFYVIATPSHESDYAVLKHLLTSAWAPRYIGMLASKRKAAGFIQQLRDELGKDLDLSNLYTPVGLDLGGSTPEEIALAIVAEIQAVRYAKPGHRHLRQPSDAPEKDASR